MIKNIIFDMGNVLIYYKPKEFIKRLNFNETDSRILYEEIFASPDWARLDDGSMNEEEIIELFNSRIPEYLHDACRKLVLEWQEPLLEIPGMYDLVKDLKNMGLKIYLLSNASSRQHTYWPRISASVFFDGTLISADVKMVKPGLQIYKKLFETFSLIPEECVFIDDSEPNIVAAKSLGMNGIIFKDDAEAVRSELMNMLRLS